MNKTAIKNFAIGARVSLISAVTQRAYEYEITKEGENTAALDQVSGRPLTPTEKSQRSQLIARINEKGFDNVMEEAAYTWFNRFTALRYMEVNGYLPTRIKVFSNENDEFKPEILSQALDVEIEGLDKSYIVDLIDAQDNETLYKYLLIAQCNALNKGLPELFEQIGGWTELLFPRNLLREDSVIARMVKDIPQQDWQDQVQIIGWLYQYYNSEPKDKVFANLKKNIKISKDDIPAATQLFTPDWIVRYMVENSLGRLWAEGHGKIDSADWKYYLEEAQQEESVKAELEKLRAEYAQIKPEQIKFLDPCMGSGHILVYAFDVLMDIYTQQGWSERDAAVSIITKNLYGLDIDRRAYQLAYFSLMMKARQYNRRLLSLSAEGACTPNLANFQDIGRFSTDMLTGEIAQLAGQFENCDTYGSLIDVQEIQGLDEAIDEFHGVIGFNAQQLERMMQLYKILSQQYDVVCTNPPYMGGSGMNSTLSGYVKKYFPDSKSDLFACFIERCGRLVKQNGFYAMITQHAWMFLSSYENLRKKLMFKSTINMAHLGARAFDEICGEVVQTTAFVDCGRRFENHSGTYVRLVDIVGENEKCEGFLSGEKRFTAKQENFSKIPGMPVAYWVSENLICDFNIGDKLKQHGDTRQGMATSDNNRFLRLWYEIYFPKLGIGYSDALSAKKSNLKWFPYNKGGEFRKWYGNVDYTINYENDGFEVKQYATSLYKTPSRTIKSMSEYFKPCVSWSKISSGSIAFRYYPKGFIFDVAGCSIFYKNESYMYYDFGFINSKITKHILEAISPTLNYEAGHIASLPIIRDETKSPTIQSIVKSNIIIAKQDWDSFETSWDFERHPLI